MSFAVWVRPRVPWIALVSVLSVSALFLLVLYMQDFPAMRESWERPVLDGRLPLLGDIHRITGLGLMAQLWLAPLVLALLVAATLFTIEFLAWRLRIDRRDDAWSTLAWSLRTWRAWLPWGLAACALVVFVEGLEYLDLEGRVATVVRVTTIALVLPLLVWLPFLAFNAANVEGDPSPARLRMRWPGWRVVAMYFAVFLLIGLMDRAIAAADAKLLALAFRGLVWIPFLALETTVCLVWLGYVAGANEGLRHVLSAPAFRTVALQDLRLSAWFMLGIGGPAVVLSALAVFLVPEAEFSLAKGQQVPPLWTGIAALRFGPYGDWIQRAAVPFEWFLVAAYARLLVVGFGPTAIAPAATPPTHPDCGPASTAPPTA
jgi:hypothetical protein